MADDRAVEALDVVALAHDALPPERLQVVLQLDAERPVVPEAVDAAVDLARLEDEAAPRAERHDVVHAPAPHGCGSAAMLGSLGIGAPSRRRESSPRDGRSVPSRSARCQRPPGSAPRRSPSERVEECAAAELERRRGSAGSGRGGAAPRRGRRAAARAARAASSGQAGAALEGAQRAEVDRHAPASPGRSQRAQSGPALGHVEDDGAARRAASRPQRTQRRSSGRRPRAASARSSSSARVRRSGAPAPSAAQRVDARSAKSRSRSRRARPRAPAGRAARAGSSRARSARESRAQPDEGVDQPRVLEARHRRRAGGRSTSTRRWLKRSRTPGEAPRAAARALRDRREPPARGRQQVDDEVGLAEVDGAQHQRLGRERSHAGTVAGAPRAWPGRLQRGRSRRAGAACVRAASSRTKSRRRSWAAAGAAPGGRAPARRSAAGPRDQTTGSDSASSAPTSAARERPGAASATGPPDRRRGGAASPRSRASASVGVEARSRRPPRARSPRAEAVGVARRRPRPRAARASGAGCASRRPRRRARARAGAARAASQRRSAPAALAAAPGLSAGVSGSPRIACPTRRSAASRSRR